MLTKLTLTIDTDIVESAKRYAKKENRSISKLVSEYLANISGTKKTVLTDFKLHSPLTDSLSGMFTDNGKPYDELLTEALKSSFTNFDDGLQYFSAVENSCEYIITRNITDYKAAKLRVCSPENFIQLFR